MANARTEMIEFCFGDFPGRLVAGADVGEVELLEGLFLGFGLAGEDLSEFCVVAGGRRKAKG